MKRNILTLCFVLGVFSLATAQKPVSILPKPSSVQLQEGTFTLPQNPTIFGTKAKATQTYLTEALKTRFGLQTAKAAKASGAAISLLNKNTDPKSEKYQLSVSAKGISIEAESEAGLFYGVQSLLQLMRGGQADGKIVLSAMNITDAPRFAWRSFMLDEARNFKGEKEVLRLLDVMAELKMNVFHWHLTDDQGWRVESKKYPLLTQIGSKRKDTQVGGWGSDKRAGEPHEGFYTQKQIKSILAYATARHIKIVPEIEMPGHASAPIAAYPWLGSKDEQIEVPVVYGKHYAVYNVTNPKVEKFLQDIVSEMIALFKTDVIHIGGDEVRFTQWEQNPEIVKYKEAKKFNSFMDIQIEFSNKMSHFIESKGASMMGWNEILGKNLHADDNIGFSDPSQKVAKNVVVQFWKGNMQEMANAAKDGYKMVNSYDAFTYLDYNYNSIPLSKAYKFDPIPNGLSAEYQKNIIGSGCQMWGEWIYTVEAMNRMIYPRIAAYSEVFWSQKENKDYNDFLQRLVPVARGWKAKGIIMYPTPELGNL